MTDDIEERIKERAFQIWIEEGQPKGRERDNWEQAKAEIAAEDKQGSSPSAERGHSKPSHQS